MEANVGDARAPKQCLSFAEEVSGQDGRPNAAAKDQIMILPLITGEKSILELLCVVPVQEHDYTFGQVDRALALLSLGLDQRERVCELVNATSLALSIGVQVTANRLKAPFDIEHARLKIDLRPTQPQNFTTPEPKQSSMPLQSDRRLLQLETAVPAQV